MPLSRDELKEMDSEQRVREELKRAREYGLSFSGGAFINPEGRSSLSTQHSFSHTSQIPPTAEEEISNDRDFAIGPSAPTKPLVEPLEAYRSTEDPDCLKDKIKKTLGRLNDGNRERLLPEIVEAFHSLKRQQGPESDDVLSIQKELTRAVFGTTEFQDEQEKPGGGMGPS